MYFLGELEPIQSAVALREGSCRNVGSYSFHLYDQNVTAITDVRAVSLQHPLQPGGRAGRPREELHQRGDASLGFVTHDYKIEHPPC